MEEQGKKASTDTSKVVKDAKEPSAKKSMANQSVEKEKRTRRAPSKKPKSKETGG